MSTSVYNTTDGPLLIDQAGRVLGARERLDDVDPSSSPIAGHLKADRLVIVDTSPADDVEAGEPQAVEGAAPITPTPRKPRGTTTPQEG